MAREAAARIRINKLLEASGWRFFKDENGPANVCLEAGVKITRKQLDAFGNDFETVASGLIDFLLLDGNGFPVAVLEAKREEKNPLDAKEQARDYARGCGVHFIILSNGDSHYFWDTEKDNPTPISTFPRPDSLEHRRDFQPDPKNLVKEVVNNDYIILTQRPDYRNDPRWRDEKQRDAFLEDNRLMMMRDYQVKAVRSIQREVADGRERFLFEMATGTGKTLIAAAVIKLFLRTSNAKRVLFLVDRLELEDQAAKAFVRYLKNDYKTVVYKKNRTNWQGAEIVVTTVQSLLVDNKFRRIFSPTDFDLVISDEAHRSISGDSRAVFEYFVGYKLGLTATPKDYLKNIKNIDQRDPREIERRILLDSYKTFGCEAGDPTFRYSLLDGVADKFLVNPIVVDARTDITTQLLSDEGYSVIIEDEKGEEVEAIYTHKDFEWKFLSEETNVALCKAFMENALRDPITDEIGKTICFCVSQNHASKIAQILNVMAMKAFPGKYNSDFAIQVTSSIPDSQQFSINFANNNLRGKTRFAEGYDSSKARVCVTCGMMTTGYDCEDILNLCLMRPVFSPTDFVQIKGRGTRRYTFKYKDPLSGPGEMMVVKKTGYKLFDFFATCEYFEEKYNYDEVIKLPPKDSGGGGGGGGQDLTEYENFDNDPLKTIVETPIGTKGMRIDREFFGRFEEVVRKDAFVARKVEDGDFDAAEAYIVQNIFGRPEDYFDLEKLRKGIKLGM